MDFVKVVWKDAWTSSEVMSLDDIIHTELLTAISTGIIVDEDKHRIALMSFWFEDENSVLGYRHVQFIPTANIISITRLTPKRIGKVELKKNGKLLASYKKNVSKKKGGK